MDRLGVPLPGGRPTGLLPSGVGRADGVPGDAAGGVIIAPGNCIGRPGEPTMPTPGTPGKPTIPGMGDTEVGVDMGGAIGIDIGMDIGKEPGVPAMTAGLVPGVDIMGAVLDCAAGEGEANPPTGNPGAAESAGEPATPAEPSLARDDGSGLCDAPSTPDALETIIL